MPGWWIVAILFFLLAVAASRDSGPAVTLA
jgi:hypothetical protein